MGIILPLLVEETGLTEQDVMRIIANAPVRYKTYTIPKRNGERRFISQPARELKVLQRVVAEKILAACPVHAAAMAYRKGVSIRKNALAHASSGPILKMDFKDFFPSITDKDWRAYCGKSRLFADEEDVEMTTRIFFHRPRGRTLRLAIGAPSSPMLSNILMYDFDEKVSQRVMKDHVIYTRYADDLTFSAKRTGFLTGVKETLQSVIRETPFPTLTLNVSKTVTATKKFKRMVTGLILTNEGKVSIGQRRKREVRAALHHQTLGQLDTAAQARLAGLLAFINDVEPEFLARLTTKYGRAVIDQLKAAPRLMQSLNGQA